MNDLIIRQDAIDSVIKRIEYSECGESVDHNKVLADIKSIPSADVVEVVHGYWIAEPFGYGECSHCHAKTGNRFAEKFCHNCGARMDGGK